MPQIPGEDVDTRTRFEEVELWADPGKVEGDVEGRGADDIQMSACLC